MSDGASVNGSELPAMATSSKQDRMPATDEVGKGDGVSKFDLQRARTPLPRPAYQGVDFAHMNSVLNSALIRMPAVSFTKECFEFSSDELRHLLSEHLLGAASASLLAVYDATPHDGRRRVGPQEADEFNLHWSAIDDHAKASSTAAQGTLQEMHRDRHLRRRGAPPLVHRFPNSRVLRPYVRPRRSHPSTRGTVSRGLRIRRCDR